MGLIGKELDRWNLVPGDVWMGILNHPDSHWGVKQTGVMLRSDGRFVVSKNRRYRDEDYDLAWPTHRTLLSELDDEAEELDMLPPVDGDPQKKIYVSAIYAYGYAEEKPAGTIWIYSFGDDPKILEAVKPALRNMVGKFGITPETKVKSNNSRKLLFTLKDIMNDSGQRGLIR